MFCEVVVNKTHLTEDKKKEVVGEVVRESDKKNLGIVRMPVSKLIDRTSPHQFYYWCVMWCTSAFVWFNIFHIFLLVCFFFCILVYPIMCVWLCVCL